MSRAGSAQRPRETTHDAAWQEGLYRLSASKTHILIVDDDTAIRETLRYVLEDADYCVDEARDGLKALEFLRRTSFSMIVLLDLMMPQMDGAGLLGTVAGDTRRLRRHRYILMTAGQQTLSLALAHLLTDLKAPVIYKPFNIDKLLEVIANQKRSL